MAKIKTAFVCTECGAETAKWMGRCPECGSWNTIQEEPRAAVSAARPAGLRKPQRMDKISPAGEGRLSTGSAELDRALGGGIVAGSLMLLGGEPGVGKSTLLLQICRHIGAERQVLYVSGEESAVQIKLRAQRLGADAAGLLLLCETDIEAVADAMTAYAPALVIVDSIQTMRFAGAASSAGSVTQVRECTGVIMRAAKEAGVPVFIVGHINKDGAIAGPKVMEHIVDCVLIFEGDTHTHYRMLRCLKNRYGSTHEIGVFEMGEKGLLDVENPSAILLSGRPVNVPGTCVACAVEGSRSLLAEIQGLAAVSVFGNPRRTTTGFDVNRLALLLAVLEKRSGYCFSGCDAYVNVVGGFRLDEPAADLPVALALISSLKDAVIDVKTAAFGEVGLAGEIRAVSRPGERVAEAARLGFTRIVVPYHNLSAIPARDDIRVLGLYTVRDAMEQII